MQQKKPQNSGKQKKPLLEKAGEGGGVRGGDKFNFLKLCFCSVSFKEFIKKNYKKKTKQTNLYVS